MSKWRSFHGLFLAAPWSAVGVLGTVAPFEAEVQLYSYVDQRLDDALLLSVDPEMSTIGSSLD